MEQLELPELDLSIFLNAELLKGYLVIYAYKIPGGRSRLTVVVTGLIHHQQ